MPFLTSAGVNLRYDRAGSGPMVLLVHAWACNRTFWERQVHGLRDRFTLVTVDLRGHGESSHPQKGYGIGAMAGDLEALVRALRVPAIAVVGWSLGGLVSIELARRLGDRVRALGLVGVAAKVPAESDERRVEMAEGIERDFRGFVRTVAAGFLKEGAASPLYAWMVQEMQKTPPHVAAATFQAAVEFDATPRLKALSLPVMIFHGRHDALVPFAQSNDLASAIKGAKVTAFEESGHAPALEEPDAFNAALAEFLSQPADAPATAAPSGKPAKKRARPRKS